MADPGYLRSTDGNDADDGSTWALANATMVGALTDAAAGNRIYVSQVHNEANAATVTLTGPGTYAAPVIVACGNDAAEPPTASATGATINTNNTVALNIQGITIWKGITFAPGNGGASNTSMSISTAGVNSMHLSEDCTYHLNGSSGSSRINLGPVGSTVPALIRMINPTFRFGNASQAIIFGRCHADIIGGSISASGSAPTSFILGGNGGGDLNFRGTDLSVMGSGTNLVNVASFNATQEVNFIDCKLGASVAVITGTIPIPGIVVRLHNSDSADTNYRYEIYRYGGSIVSVTDTYITSDGAYDGTTRISWKIDSLSSGASYASPIWTEPFSEWNESTGSSKTITVEFLHDAAADLDDDDICLEVEYLGTSGFPRSTMISTRRAQFASAAAYAVGVGASAWTKGTPVTGWRSQKMTVSITPQEKGTIIARVGLMNTSKTVYVDPRIRIT